MEDIQSDKREDDPTEEEIKKRCADIRKGWDNNQRKSRCVYKTKDYTVSVIKVTDIEGDYN